MGRPREHNLDTKLALITAAEEIVSNDGPEALSIRTVADAARTTARAVYTLFGSKEGLVDALAQRAFELIAERLTELPYSEDPAADLLEVGATVIRGFVLEHPALHRIAFLRVVPGLQPGPELSAARQRAVALLETRMRRLADTGELRQSPEQATIAFNAVCEGLANNELRGQTFRTIPAGREAEVWRTALRTVLDGLTAADVKRPAELAA